MVLLIAVRNNVFRRVRYDHNSVEYTSFSDKDIYFFIRRSPAS
jgi:hypothetical protein